MALLKSPLFVPSWHSKHAFTLTPSDLCVCVCLSIFPYISGLLEEKAHVFYFSQPVSISDSRKLTQINFSQTKQNKMIGQQR